MSGTKPGTWKSRLLSSSIPLEHAAARCLASKGYLVEADYAYARPDSSGVIKDFSVDLHGEVNLELSPCRAALDLLVECKYRNPSVAWLFLPEPNADPGEDSSTVGHMPVIVDEFSPFHLDREASERFAQGLPLAYKGIEVSTEGHAHSAELTHGIEQLRYAIPRCMKEAIEDGLWLDWDQVRPRLIAPVLVTTAPLFLAPSDFSPATVESADDVASLGQRVPWLLLRSEVGPDFGRYCAQAFAEYREDRELGEGDINPDWGLIACPLMDLEVLHKPYSASGMSLLRGLNGKRQFGLERYFSEFLICSFEHLPALLDELDDAVADACADGLPLQSPEDGGPGSSPAKGSGSTP